MNGNDVRVYARMHVCIRAPLHQGFMFIIVIPGLQIPFSVAVHLRLTAPRRRRPLPSVPRHPPFPFRPALHSVVICL